MSRIRAKDIGKLLSRVAANVNADIARSIDRSSRYSAALAREGYNGGYVDAINDVVSALYGNHPRRNGWWPE